MVTQLAPCSWYLAIKSPCETLPDSLHQALPKGSVRHSPKRAECPESTSRLPSPARLLPGQAASREPGVPALPALAPHVQAPPATFATVPWEG